MAIFKWGGSLILFLGMLGVITWSTIYLAEKEFSNGIESKTKNVDKKLTPANNLNKKENLTNKKENCLEYNLNNTFRESNKSLNSSIKHINKIPETITLTDLTILTTPRIDTRITKELPREDNSSYLSSTLPLDTIYKFE